MMKTLGTCLGVIVLLAAAAILPAGCTVGTSGTSSTTLQDATAVQLETSLISSLDAILKYGVYQAMGLSVSGSTALL